MSEHSAGPDDYPCIELVRRITHLFEGSMTTTERDRIQEHLATCSGCRAALAQFELTIQVMGRIDDADVRDLDPATLDQLTAIFTASN